MKKELSQPFVKNVVTAGLESGSLDAKTLYNFAFSQEQKDKFAVENVAGKSVLYRLTVLSRPENSKGIREFMGYLRGVQSDINNSALESKIFSREEPLSPEEEKDKAFLSGKESSNR